jgi:hypothetical protein
MVVADRAKPVLGLLAAGGPVAADGSHAVAASIRSAVQAAAKRRKATPRDD